jgi:hypothetical protein
LRAAETPTLHQADSALFDRQEILALAPRAFRFVYNSQRALPLLYSGEALRRSNLGDTMKKLLLAIALAALASHAAAASNCAAQAKEKNLAGAAHASFMKKCQANAKATCEDSAKAKNLQGAAQGSFIKKCVKDAVGS